MATDLERESLSGAQKAAVLCMSLGTDVASKVMQLLSADQVEVVSREIAAMPMADTGTVEHVLLEYRQVARAVQSLSEGGLRGPRRYWSNRSAARRPGRSWTRSGSSSPTRGSRSSRRQPPRCC